MAYTTKINYFTYKVLFGIIPQSLFSLATLHFREKFFASIASFILIFFSDSQVYILSKNLLLVSSKILMFLEIKWKK